MVVGAKKKEREHKRAEHAANEDRTLGKVGPQVQLADFPELDHVLRRSALLTPRLHRALAAGRL
jgi:hypothetical protein